MTEDEIEAAKSPKGGWTRATLAQWGVPWPPPKGWRRALVRGEPIQAAQQIEPSEKFAFHINDAAKVGGVSRSELYKALKSGDLRAKKLGKRTLILRDELARFLEALPDYAPSDMTP